MISVLPLEDCFRKACESKKSKLPGPHDYKSTYFSILSILREKIYPAIDLALSNLSQPPGIYTYHNGDHFDEVVRIAGELVWAKPRPQSFFTAYELFVLLLAIRIHDAGNILGRSGHEKRCTDILADVFPGGFPFGDTELNVIGEIAQAHGGTTLDGNRDVIGILPRRENVGSATIRSQRIAATVRLADELAENCMRTPTFLVDRNLIPKENEIYHRYAESLHSNAIERVERGSTAKLTFSILDANAEKEFGKENRQVYLLDEIRERLIKMNRERIYCNLYLDPADRLESISAKIVIRDANTRKSIWEHEYLIRDEGYPEMKTPLALESLNSAEILDQLKSRTRK